LKTIPAVLKEKLLFIKKILDLTEKSGIIVYR